MGLGCSMVKVLHGSVVLLTGVCSIRVTNILPTATGMLWMIPWSIKVTYSTAQCSINTISTGR